MIAEALMHGASRLVDPLLSERQTPIGFGILSIYILCLMHLSRVMFLLVSWFAILFLFLFLFYSSRYSSLDVHKYPL